MQLAHFLECPEPALRSLADMVWLYAHHWRTAWSPDLRDFFDQNFANADLWCLVCRRHPCIADVPRDCAQAALRVHLADMPPWMHAVVCEAAVSNGQLVADTDDSEPMEASAHLERVSAALTSMTGSLAGSVTGLVVRVHNTRSQVVSTALLALIKAAGASNVAVTLESPPGGLLPRIVSTTAAQWITELRLCNTHAEPQPWRCSPRRELHRSCSDWVSRLPQMPGLTSLHCDISSDWSAADVRTMRNVPAECRVSVKLEELCIGHSEISQAVVAAALNTKQMQSLAIVSLGAVGEYRMCHAVRAASKLTALTSLEICGSFILKAPVAQALLRSLVHMQRLRAFRVTKQDKPVHAEALFLGGLSVLAGTLKNVHTTHVGYTCATAFTNDMFK